MTPAMGVVFNFLGLCTFVLGYGNVSEENIELGIERLHKFLLSNYFHNKL